MFPIYQIATDLGTHQHYLATETSFFELLRTRLYFSIGALALAAIHGFFAEYSLESFLCLMLLVLNFLPLSLLSAYDTHFFKLGNQQKAILFRASRIFGLVVFAAVVAFFRGHSIWVPFAIMFSANMVFCALVLKKFGLFRDLSSDSTSFLQKSLEIGSAQLIASCYAALFWATLARVFGEKQLAPVSEVLTVVTPFTLGFQTIHQIFLPQVIKGERSRYVSALGLVFLFSIGVLAVFEFVRSKMSWLPQVSENLVYFSAIMLGHQFFLQLASIPYTRIQVKGHAKAAAVSYLVIAGVIFLVWQMHLDELADYFWVHFVFSCIWCAWGFVLSRVKSVKLLEQSP